MPMRATVATDPDIPHAWVRQVPSRKTKSGDVHWLRLHQHEETRLEASLASSSTVPLDGGRAEARLNQSSEPEHVMWAGTYAERYAERSPVALARSRWCFKSGRHGAWQPFDPLDDAKLERHLSLLLQQQQQQQSTDEGDAPSTNDAEVSYLPQEVVDGMVTADGLHQIHLTRLMGGGIAAEMLSLKGSGWLGRSHCSVARGWAGDIQAKLSDEELLAEALPPAALVLVVHGIGETMWRKDKASQFGIHGIDESVRKLRSLADKAAGAVVAKEPARSAAPSASNAGDAIDPAASAPSAPYSRVEFLPVDWDQTLRNDDDGSPLEWARTLQQVTIRSVPSLREFANDVICDVLLYEQPQQQRVIQTRVVERIEALVRQWRDHNPSFEASGGKIVLCGHSLGSLILFDLLTPRPPKCEGRGTTPESGSGVGDMPRFASVSAFSALVCLGSPIGCFLSLRRQRLGRTFEMPQCQSALYNIFARTDPVAYRIEPLLVETGAALGAPGEASAAAQARAAPDEQDASGAESETLEGHDSESDEDPILPPPEYVPFAGAKSGKRLHIKLRQAISSTADTLQRSVNEVQDAVERARSVASALQGWLAGARSNVADAASEESTGTRRRRAKAQSTAGGSDAPAWAINGGNRVDYQLQETELEAAQEYLAALKAHTCYFGNADLASFFLREICSR